MNEWNQSIIKTNLNVYTVSNQKGIFNLKHLFRKLFVLISFGHIFDKDDYYCSASVVYQRKSARAGPKLVMG